jgi:hypothetical protein
MIGRTTARGGRVTEGEMMASGALVVLGIILVVLGLLAASNIVLVVIGLLSILAGGVLQVAMARRA